MKTKAQKKTRVNIITLGCSKNLVDSEVLFTQLKAGSIDVRHEAAGNSEVVIVNTCGFIDCAKQESVNTILDYASLREQGKIQKLIVTGCLSERYRDDLRAEVPAVDAWFGTRDLPALLKEFEIDFKKDLLGERQTSTPPHFAYLKISEGCDRPCSFCAIPLMRGKHVSRSMEDLVSEAEFLVSRGVKEIMLIAQDSTFYGLDLYGERRLAELLERLADVEDLHWIRLHYAYPSGFPTAILKVMHERDNICNYLDMPVQHISDNMLRSMRRGITKAKTLELIRQIREEVPGIALRTTLIAGYPGETEADFQELADFIREVEFERLGVFAYSHEENTHAFQLADDVPQEVKEQRVSELMEIQQEISLEHNSKLVGTVQQVLIDRQEGEHFAGRTAYDSYEVDNEVLVRADSLPIGEFVSVRITDALEFDLFAEPIR